MRLTGNNPSDATRGDDSLTPQSSPETASSGRVRGAQSTVFAGIVFSEVTTDVEDNTLSSTNGGLHRDGSLTRDSQDGSIRSIS
jgi:hypothetical protein